MRKNIYITLALVVASFTSYAQTWVINGPSSVCPGDQNVTYSVQSSTGGMPPFGSYTWYLDGVSLGNSLSNSRDIDFPTSGSSFSVRVTGPSSIDVTKTVTSAQANPGSVSLSGGYCNAGNLTILVSGNSGNLKWQRRVGSGSWADYGVGFTDPLSQSGLTIGTQYQYRVRTNTSCATLYSNTLTVTPRNPTNAGTASGNQTICSGSSPSSITSTSASGGGGSYSYSWEKRPSGGSWTNIGGGQSLSSSEIGSLTQQTDFRRKVTDTQCGTDYSNIVTVSIYSPLNAGTIGNTQTVCYNGNPSTLTNTASASGGSTKTYQWQISSNGTSGWTNLSGATGTTYNPPTLTSSKWYRRRVISCSVTKYSNIIKVTVQPNLSAGSIGNAQTLCYNGNASTLTNTGSASGGNSSYSYQWQISSNGTSGWSNLSGATGATYNPPALTSSRWYRRRVISCSQTKYTNTVKVTIHPNLSAGSIGNAQTLCYNGNASTLTNTGSASGGDGSITYQWQYSTNGSSGWTNLSGQTGTTYNPPALTSSRWYRRRAISCGQTKYTNSIKITIHPNLTAGSIGNAQTLCYNGNASTLTNTGSASGGDGSITYQWQYSTNGSSGWTNLSGQTSTTYNPPALTSSRWYRRRAISCGQTKYTNSIKITIHPNLTAGSIGNVQTLCYNGNASTLTNTGSAGGGDGSLTYQWQYSTNGSSGWTNLSGQTGTTYNPPALTSSRWYRRRVISCGQTKYTNSVKITIHPTLNAGSIGNAQTLCYNGNASALTNTSTASGGDGSISYQWQYSTNGISGWTNLSGQTSTTYDPPALTSSRWYRRRAVSCGETKYSNSIKITIHPTLSAGSIGNAQTVCYNGNPSALTNSASASGGDGSISYQWQYSTNGTSGWTNLGSQTSTTYNPPALTSSRWYRRRAVSCGETKYTNSIKVTVNPTLNPGSIGNAQTLCYNEDPSAITNSTSPSGGDGSFSYQWQYSTNGTSGWTDLSGATSSTYDPSALIASRWYRREVVSCSETKYSNVIAVSVHNELLAGGISGNQTICYNTSAATLSSTGTASGGGSGLTYQWQQSADGTAWSNIGGATSATYSPGTLTAETWYRRGASTTDCSTVYTSSVKVSIDGVTNGGALEETVFNSSSVEVFGTTDVNLQLTGETGSIIKWQYKTSGGWIDVANTTDTYNEVNVTVPTYYRVEVKNGTCSSAYSNEVFVNVFPEPGFDFGIRTSVRPGSGTTISVDDGYSNYEWFKDDVQEQTGGSNELLVTHPGKYRVKITSGGGATFETGNATIASQLNENNNYVMVYDFREEGKDESVDVFSVPMAQMSITADIYDGLGRPIQKINMEGSPDGSDLVAPIEYDEYGRNKKSYLPYPSTDIGQLFKPDALGVTSQQKAFYDVTFDPSEKAFSENKFEASPLNRVVEQGLPGDNWAIGSSHSIKMEYQINTLSDAVTKWTMSSDLPVAGTYYGEGKLFKSVTTDENGSQTITFTNFRKDPILIKKQINASEWTETYYIYDERNRLRVVLQPEGVKNISQYAGTTEDKENFLAAWAFQYGYDAQNRQIWKQVPGANRMYTVYDVWDRVRMTQDGNQAGNQANNSKWSFIKYDVQNRPVITGILYDAANSQGMITNVTGNTVMFESYDKNTHAYIGNMYPTASEDVDLLTITFYDEYDFLFHAEWVGLDLDFDEPSPERTHMDSPYGTVTGTKTKVSDGTWIYSTSYYDEKGRLIQTRSTNHLGGVDVVTNHYNFANEVTKTITEHDNGPAITTITRDFEYDHRGRLLKTWHAVDGAPAVLLAENEYNELDEVAEKRLHSTDGTDFEQYVNYSYNIRRWLTAINDSDLNSSDPVEDLFGMELAYDENLTGLSGSINQFNGNISAMRWSNYDATGSGPDTRAYAYDYDKLSRLKIANHFEDNDSTNHFSVSNIGYDKNGNILFLNRKDDTGTNMDSLTYNYGTGSAQSNQLKYVDDVSGDSLGFDNNGTGTSIDYTYDSNGNMITDGNKGITSIEYNHLNLPIKVEFATVGDSITYLYDAAGIKLQQKVWSDDTLRKTVDYVGEFIYETLEGDTVATISQIHHEEGRLIYMDYQSKWDYQYHLKDHLGNVRVTFSTEPDVYPMVATMENSSESENFSNYVAEVDAIASNSGTYVSRNSNLVNDGLDLNTFLSVNKKDTIRMSAYAYYNDAGSSYNLAAGLIETALFGSFNANYGAEGTTVSQTNFDNAFGTGTTLGDRPSTSSAPPAFINYIFFDKEMNYITSGFAQITTASNDSSVQVVADDFVADRDGYVMVYLSNETDGSELVVSWDDFDVELSKTNIVQTDDYYPYGLTFNSSQRTASRVNNFKYNSKELDENTQWYDYGARMYQADLGRWFSVDPLADMMRSNSTYNYAFNNPLRFIDPDGRAPIQMGYGMTADGNNSGAVTHYDYGGALPGSNDEEQQGGLLDMLFKGKDKSPTNSVTRAAMASYAASGSGNPDFSSTEPGIRGDHGVGGQASGGNGAIADAAEQYLALNTMPGNWKLGDNTDPSITGGYSFGAKNPAGMCVDCSGLISGSFMAAGFDDPNHGRKGSGILNIESNLTKVNYPQRGDVFTIRNPKGYKYHGGIVTGVQSVVTGYSMDMPIYSTQVTVIHSSSRRGGPVRDSFVLGTNHYFARNLFGFFRN